MRFLFVFFIVVPLTEMLILFEVSDRIGGLMTLSMVVATAVIGVQILKRQGLSTLTRANQRMQSGELPAQEIVEGMMLAGAGALLLTPGFITDILGFIFLTGPIRRPLARKIIRSGAVKSMGAGASSSSFSFWSSSNMGGFQAGSRGPGDGDNARVYEAEYVEESPALGRSGENKPKDDKNLH